MTKSPFVWFAALGFVAPIQAVVIDIDGALNEFSDYSGQGGAVGNPDPWGPSSETDGDVTLSILNDSVNPNNGSQVGLSWNNSWSSGSYVVGAEINTMQSQSAGSTDISDSASSAIDDDRFVSIDLTTTGTAMSWDSVSVTLWRNGSGAAENYQFAYDDEGTGYDVGDLLGSPTVVGSGIGNETTVFFSGLGLPSNFTSDSVRLYFWDGTSGTGNTHITEVESTYSLIPEPATYGYLIAAFGGVLLLRRRLA